MRKFFTFISVAAFMTVSCSEKEPNTGGNSGNSNTEPKPVSFKIESSVLAFRSPSLDENGAGNFNDGDRNSVFFSDGKGSMKSAMQYTYGSTCLWDDLVLAADEEVSVTACWPELSATDKDGLMAEAEAYVWNSSKDNGKSDLLLAEPVSAVAGKTEKITLAFGHKLHKFSVELSAAEGEDISSEELAEAEIKLSGVLPEIKVNMASAALGTAQGKSADFSGKGSECWFIIPPQPAGQIELTVSFGGKDFTTKVADCNVDGKPVENLESGKVFTLKIGVSKEKPFTIVGQAISGWESQGSADGSIEL